MQIEIDSMESFLVHNLVSASCNLGRRHAPTGFWSLSLKEAIQVIKSAVPQIDAAMWGEIRRSKSLSPFEIKDDSQGLRTERLYRAEVVLQILRLSRTKLEDRVEAALKEKLVALHAVAQPADPVVGSHTPQSNQQGCAESELSCPRADLQVFTLEQAKEVIMRLEGELVQTTASLRLYQRARHQHCITLHYWRLRAKLARSEVLALRQDIANRFMKKGKYQYFFSPLGGMLMACKRALGVVTGAQAASDMLEAGASRQSIVFWEVRAAACVALRHVAFHREGLAMMDSCSNHHQVFSGFSIYVLRGDCTNSAILQEAKLQTLHLSSLYARYADGGAALSTMCASQWCDLAVVSEQSGKACFATVDKQLRQVGLNLAGNLHAGLGGDAPDGTFRCLIIVTDGGSDQRKYRQYMYSLSVGVPRTLFLEQDCVKHGMHILFKNHLACADSWFSSLGLRGGYFSAIAKIMHLSRGTGAMKKLLAAWSSIDVSGALKFAGRRWPRPLIGRWGNVELCEKTLLLPFLAYHGPGRNLFIRLILEELCGIRADEAFSKDAGAAVAPAVAAVELNPEKPQHSVIVEGVSTETMEDYRKRLSKWKSHVMEIVVRSEFWFVMSVSYKAHAPLDHFSNWCSSTDPDRPTKFPTKIDLVCKQLAVIEGEFGSLVDEQVWMESLTIADLPRSQAMGIITHAVLGAASSFHHRLFADVCCYPSKLCWLVYHKPDKACDRRREVANEILEGRATNILENSRTTLENWRLSSQTP